MSKSSISTPKASPENSKQDCLKNWEEDLKSTNNNLRIVCAERDKEQQALANATLWMNKLKGYFDAFDITYNKSVKITSVLQVFNAQITTVCDNTKCLVKATKILYCMVKESFVCLDELKVKLTDLTKEIECLNLPELNPKSSIVLQCLDTLCTKVDEARANQSELLKTLIKLVKCAAQLDNMICDEDCGIKSNVNYLYGIFQEGNYQTDDNTHATESTDPDCKPCVIKSRIELKLDCPTFPLNCGDNYYTQTKKQYNDSIDDVECIRGNYIIKRQKCEQQISCKKSLEEAIEASKAAKECK